MARTKQNTESGRARARRLLRESLCKKCGAPALITINTSHRPYHICSSCFYGKG